MGSPSPPTVTSTNTFTPSADQQSLINQIMPGALSAGAKGFQQYQGPTVAGFTGNQLQGQSGAISAAGGAGTQLGTQGAGALGTLMDPNMLNIGSNPNFTNLAGTMTSLADRNLLQSILPGVTSGSTMAGGQYAGGGTRGDLAVGKAIGDTSIGTNAAIQQLATSMYGQGIQGMLGASGQVPLMQQAQLFGPNVMEQVGSMEQQLQQAQMNAAQSQFYGGQMLPWMAPSMTEQILQGLPGGTSTSTQTGAVPGSSPFQQALGGAMGLGSMAPFLNWMFPTAAGSSGLGTGLGTMFGSALGGIGSGLSSLGSGGMGWLASLMAL